MDGTQCTHYLLPIVNLSGLDRNLIAVNDEEVSRSSLAALLTACSVHYLKPEGTRQDFDRDYDACNSQAAPPLYLRVAAPLLFTPAAMVMADRWKYERQDCMRNLGYN